MQNVSHEQSLRKIQLIESEFLKALIKFLKEIYPEFSKENLIFLCEPWAHFFTHSALYLYYKNQLTQENFSTIEINYNSNIPGDTLSFFEFFRTPEYSNYLNQRLIRKHFSIKCRSEIHTFEFQHSKKIKTECFKPCFPRSFRYFLKIFSFGQIQFANEKEKCISTPTNWDLRQKLKVYLEDNLPLELGGAISWMSVCSAELFPKSLLENLRISYQRKSTIKQRKIMFSADA